MGVLEKNSRGWSEIIYASTMMLLAGESHHGIHHGNLTAHQAPCYHCNPIDPKFGKEKKPEKEPGVLYLQANTVRLNPVSNSEIKIAFTFEKPKGWMSVPATPSTASIHGFDIRST